MSLERPEAGFQMPNGNEPPPARKAGDRRAERLAAALKQNLKKRKEQARARQRPDEKARDDGEP